MTRPTINTLIDNAVEALDEHIRTIAATVDHYDLDATTVAGQLRQHFGDWAHGTFSAAIQDDYGWTQYAPGRWHRLEHAA